MRIVVLTDAFTGQRVYLNPEAIACVLSASRDIPTSPGSHDKTYREDLSEVRFIGPHESRELVLSETPVDVARALQGSN